MFPQPAISSNLEWLLQSPQSTPDLLARAVWEACGQQITALGAALFGEAHAGEFGVQVVAACVLQAEQYTADLPPCTWVWRVSLQCARRLAAARRASLESAFVAAARHLGCARETLLAAWDGKERRFCALWEQVPDSPPPFEMRIDKEWSLPAEDLLPEADLQDSEFPLPPTLLRAVHLARRVAARRQRRTHLVEALLLLLVTAVTLLGLRIGQALDTHHNVVSTQVVVVRVTASPAVVTRIPTPIAQTPIAQATAQGLHYLTREGDTPAVLAWRFGVSLESLLTWNNLIDPQMVFSPGTVLTIPPVATPAPPQPLATLAPLVEISTDLPVLLERVRQQAWSTLWADVFIADYGPEGYTGYPKISRQQVWLAGESHALLLQGGPENIPLDVWLMPGDGRVLHAHMPEARFSPVDSDWMDPRLQALLFPARLLDTFGGMPAIRRAGIEQVSGRQALHVDVLRPGGLHDSWWIDAQYGILLRRQVFSRRGALLYETLVSNVSFNFIPEAALFSPSSTPNRFAASPRGDRETSLGRPIYRPLPAPAGHVPLPIKTPPPDLDLSKATLTFQWDEPPPEWIRDSKDVHKYIPVRMYADGYKLDSWFLEWMNPYTMSPCVRLADRIVWLDDDALTQARYWTALSGAMLTQGRLFLGDGWYWDEPVTPRPWMVFSTDGRDVYLAADSPSQGMGIYHSRHGRYPRGDMNRLFNAFHTGPLALSPSGTQLAWLEYRDTDTWELVLADLESQSILSRQVVTISMGEDGLPLNLPYVWGKPFPWPLPGVLNCEAPPSD